MRIELATMATPKDQPQPSQEQTIRTEWLTKEGEAVDRATVGSGMIPRLHEQFTQSGLSVGYMIVDASQISTAFPFPVYSRYIMPVLDSEKAILNPEKDNIYPGLAIINFMASRRAVYVQIGLGQEDLYKTGVVGQAHINIHGSEFSIVTPSWWPNDIVVPTTYFRLDDCREGVPDEHKDAFWWTPPDDDRILDLTYEEEKTGFSVETTWDAENPQIVQALGAQKALIQKLLDDSKNLEE